MLLGCLAGPVLAQPGPPMPPMPPDQPGMSEGEGGEPGLGGPPGEPWKMQAPKRQFGEPGGGPGKFPPKPPFPKGPFGAPGGGGGGGGGAAGGAGGMAGPPPWFNPQIEDTILRTLKEHDPGRFEEVQRIRFEKPGAYFEVLKDALHDMEQLERLKDKDPDEFNRRQREKELHKKVMELVKEYRKQNDDKRKTEITSDVRKLLEEQFDVRQASREARIQRLEKELTLEKERLGKRKASKQLIIDTHFKDMVGENDLRW
ncbi:MAG: hypothetical protein HY815_03045 [Candidatus Riflebacteria bacterium]|nr:hypothetical protein [Candidatus Riflebacteria bacterium]